MARSRRYSKTTSARYVPYLTRQRNVLGWNQYQARRRSGAFRTSYRSLWRRRGEVPYYAGRAARLARNLTYLAMFGRGIYQYAGKYVKRSYRPPSRSRIKDFGKVVVRKGKRNFKFEGSTARDPVTRRKENDRRFGRKWHYAP